MPENKEEIFNNIDYVNKVVSKPHPDRVTDIDTKNKIYDNIIDAQERGDLDITSINSFTSISKSRDQVYSLLDMMGNDPIISSALEIYASDATEPNEQGKVMWCEAKDENISGAVNTILDSFNVDKNAYSQVYSLCKYGDIYLKLYRDSEFNYDDIKEKIKDDVKKLNEGNLSDEDKKSLKESIILKMYSKNDRYADYAEQVKNPAEVFDLIKFGKTCGYIKTNINSLQIDTENKIIPNFNSNSNLYNYRLNYNDIDIYGATEFVHGCLEDNSDRVEEQISIFRDNDNITDSAIKHYNYHDDYKNEFDRQRTYDTDLNSSGGGSYGSSSFAVRRGKSILYDSFKAWRELTLLENSVLLNRLTRSSILRTINVEVGDMGKNEVQTLLRRIKTMVEQKTAYNVNSSMQDYVNPSPSENILYFPTHGGVGAVSTNQIGGDVEVGDLNDLDYWKKKVFASLGIPGQYLGDTDDNTGFNGGTSLSLISSRYAKTIKRIQNTYIQMYTDAVNLILLDKGLKNYVNKFTLHMQYPATQEERDRKENLSNSINNVRELMGLLDEVEDRQVRLEILKSLLSTVISNQEVLGFIQEEIDKLESTAVDETASGGSDELDYDGGGGGGFDDFDFDNAGGEDVDLDVDTVASEPLDTGDFETPEVPEENFYQGTGEPLNETNDLPSFSDLGISFKNVR